jgi:hypothetical protein
MRELKATMLTIGVLALSAAVAFAQGSKPAAARAAAAKPAAAKAMSLSGTISAFDATANTLTVKTSSGDQAVQVGSHTKIHEGSKNLKANELGGLAGKNVKVRCKESNGKMMAEVITIAAATK